MQRNGTASPSEVTWRQDAAEWHCIALKGYVAPRSSGMALHHPQRLRGAKMQWNGIASPSEVTSRQEVAEWHCWYLGIQRTSAFIQQVPVLIYVRRPDVLIDFSAGFLSVCRRILEYLLNVATTSARFQILHSQPSFCSSLMQCH
jgi:hypothetical protein